MRYGQFITRGPLTQPLFRERMSSMADDMHYGYGSGSGWGDGDGCGHGDGFGYGHGYGDGEGCGNDE